MSTNKQTLEQRLEILSKTIEIQTRMEIINRLQKEIVELEQERQALTA